MSEPVMRAGHFPGCHPEDAEAAREAPNPIPDTEPCWHCGTPTTRGTCYCADCMDEDYIPQSAVYHCPLCARWWAYMTGLNVTEITFGEAPEEAPN
jgi:hypothetical protein